MSEAAASATGGQGVVVDSNAPLNVTPAPVNAPITANNSWLDGADELTVGYVQNKGWTDPKQVLDGYRNLEKLLGADKAGNALVLPKHDAKPEEWGAVYDRLGRPSGPDGYKAIEGADPAVQNSMFSKFHELGLTKNQGENLADWIANLGRENQAKAQMEAQQRFAQDDAAIKAEWGAAYNQNLAQAQNAARGLGLDSDAIDQIAGALGHAAAMNLFQKIGASMSEDRFVTGDRTETFNNALTPGQAKAQIQSLMQDRDFSTKYLAGNAEAKAKMEALHRFAYPEG